MQSVRDHDTSGKKKVKKTVIIKILLFCIDIRDIEKCSVATMHHLNKFCLKKTRLWILEILVLNIEHIW